jgi:hypothetical protein
MQYAAIGVLFNGFSGILAARALGPLQFSAFASALAIITTLQVLFQGLQFSSHAAFSQSEVRDIDTRLELHRFVKQGALLTFLFATLIFGLRSQLNITTYQVLAISFMVFPGLALASVSGFYLWTNDLIQYQRLSTVNAGFRILLTLTLSFAASLFEFLKSPAVFLLILVISNFLSLFCVKNSVPKSVFLQSRILSRASAYSVAIVFLGWLLIQGDLILFNAALVPSEAGKIAAYSSVAKVPVTLVGLIGLVVIAKFGNNINRRYMFKSSLGLFAVSCLFALLAVLFGDTFMNLTYGSIYEIDRSYLPELLLANILWAVFLGLLNMHLKARITPKLAFALLSIFMLTAVFGMLIELTIVNIQFLSIAASLLGIIILILI